MLKFLHGRPEDQSPKRSPIKYKPEMCYGNSYESPPEFQTDSTIFYRPSYVNPFLPFEANRAKEIKRNTSHSIRPEWTRKTNLTMIEVSLV